MTRCKKSLILFAGAWILWEHIMAPSGPERWRSMGSIPSQQACFSHSQKMAEEGAGWHDYNRPAGVRVELNRASNPPSFYLIGDRGTQRHIFECYPSDFDPRPRG